MKYVLDASIAVKWVLPESDSSLAKSLRDRILSGDIDAVAPDTFLVEVAHALTRAERRGTIPAGQASFGVRLISLDGPNLHPYVPLLPRAVELSSMKRIGVYDCLYVALAEELDCELVTADAKLVNAFSESSRIVLLSDL